jgi:hypothetical protein
MLEECRNIESTFIVADKMIEGDDRNAESDECTQHDRDPLRETPAVRLTFATVQKCTLTRVAFLIRLPVRFDGGDATA